MKKLLLFLIAFIAAIVANAQSELKVFSDWSSTTGSQNFFQKNEVTTDVSGNVYIAGATKNGSNNYDILVAKYNSSGTQLWIQQYNGAGNGDDIATAIRVDNSGNVYITGAVNTATNVDMITIKYNSSGTQQWLQTYDGVGSSYDCGIDVFTDINGNVYVAGSTYNANYNTDVVSIKYNSSGTQQWLNTYNNTANLNDAGAKISEKGGVVATTALIQTNSTTYTAGVIKYNTSSGAFISSSFNGSASSDIDQISDVVEDASGNIYIAGSGPVSGQGYDYQIVKLNNNLTLAWQNNFNLDGLDDFAKGIRVDNSGNVYITGYSTSSTQGKNISTVKFNSSGTQQWIQTYNDALNGDDEANAMAIDATGNIYITGYTSTEMDHKDYYTIKYDGSGTEIWNKHNDNPNHLDDIATNIAIDNNNDIVISGSSETSTGSFTYYTIKYVERQIITPTDYNSEQPNNSFLFYRNSGQLIDTGDSLIPNIKFYTNNSSPSFYFKKNSFSFVFAHADTSASTNDTLHRIDATFDESGSTAKTYEMDEQPSYLNYFLGHCPNGITEVHGNERLVTYALYPNIDLVYSSNQDGIKYYFVIKPGGDPTRIKMTYAGATSFNLDGTTNALTINSLIGKIIFQRPTAYQLSSTNTVIPITGWQCAWQTNGASNKYKFYTSTYDNAKALIIQVDLGHTTFTPTTNGNLDWSTWVGGAGDDIAIDVASDNTGVFVVGGTSSNNFPYNTGTVTNVAQANFGGYRDAFATRFDNQAKLEWTTYIGGSNYESTNLNYPFPDDAAIGVVHDNLGRICFTGYTWCTDFPTKANGTHYFQDYLGGDCDAFIVQLNSNGGLLWSTYFGGNTRDFAHSILRNNSGEIFICGSVAGWEFDYPNDLILIGDNSCLPPEPPTYNSGFPICNSNGNSYYHQTHSGGEYDAFIARFNSNGELNWNTFFGGSERDAARDIILDPTDNSVYLTGYTQSSIVGNNTTTSPCNAPTDNGFPLCNLGGNSYFQSTYPGGYQNAFISKFNGQNQLLWSTFFGSEDESFGSHLVLNSNGDLYLTGVAQTQTSYDLPDNYCVVPTNGGFPLCNPGNGAYFRNNDNVDVGWDIFITKFNTQKQIIWSTFYGGSDDDNNLSYFPEDANTGIALDNNDNVYITGSSTKVINTLGDIDKYTPSNYYNQDNIGTGATRDAFIAVFNNNNQPIWATYFGGGGTTYNASDIGSALTISNNNKLYLVGATNSTTFPQQCPNTSDPYCQPALANAGSGTYDAFIAGFDILNISGLDNIESSNNNLSIYPNPTLGNITISCNIAIQPSNVIIQIYDNLGQLILSKNAKDFSSKFSCSLNLCNLPNGLYMVKVDIGQDSYSKKIIKQN